MAREGDVVLIYHQDQPAVFARVEYIEPDVKKDWYRITLLLLTTPTQVVTWILRGSYIEGSPFTMGGKPMRLETVKRTDVKGVELDQEERKKPGKTGTIIPFKKP